MSVGWFCFIAIISIDHTVRRRQPLVWLSGIRDFPWYGLDSPATAQDINQSPVKHTLSALLIGRSRGRSVRDDFIRPVLRFIFGHTPFRRLVGVEPVWLSVVRGFTALSFISSLAVYAVLACIVNPLLENDSTLPTRPMGVHAWSGAPPMSSIDSLFIVVVSDHAVSIGFFLTLRSLGDILGQPSDEHQRIPHTAHRDGYVSQWNPT